MNFTIEELLSLVDLTIEEKINNIHTKEGKRGLRGKPGVDGVDGLDGQNGIDGVDGKSISFESEKEKFLNLFIENKTIFKGARGQKGQSGKDGIDGKSFNWDDYKDAIFERIDKNSIEVSQSIREEIYNEVKNISLSFEDLTEEQKSFLRGPRGLRGQKGSPGRDGNNGENFNWEDHKDKIINHLNTLKLKFDDFTEIEKNELRGPQGFRGQRGKRGNDGEKGDKGDRGLTGVPGIKGLDGKNGINGLNGRDGVDGKDAPRIIDIQLKEWNNKFYFEFYFDDGTEIETKKIEKPIVSQMVSQIVQSATTLFSIPISDESIEITNKVRSLNFTGDIVTATDDGSGNVTVNVSIDEQGIVIPNLDCDASVYIGAAVILNNSDIVVNALADNITTSNVLGFVESKPSSVLCNVRVSGRTLQNFAGLDVTKDYYLSDSVAGGIQTNVPTTTGHVKLRVGQPIASNRMVFLKGEPVIRA